MAEIIKVYGQRLPAMRFIGKRFADHGGWGDMFANGWFELIEQSAGGADVLHHIPGYGQDGDAYIGLECHKDGELLEVVIGMFAPPGTEVPEGFAYIDYAAGTNLGVCWIYGEEQATHGLVGQCVDKLIEAGMQITTDEQGATWSFERCQCPRFTTPDEHGNVILDCCYFVK